VMRSASGFPGPGPGARAVGLLQRPGYRNVDL